ncbi:hypothetical protein [Thiobacillus sp.]
MTTSVNPDLLEKPTKAAQFLSSTIAHEKDVAALASLNDDQLLRFVFKSFKASRRTQAANIASHIASTFERIATLLAAQDAENLLSVAKKRAHDVHTGLVARKAVIPSGKLTDALGITRQALSKAVQANRIFSVEVGGENYYPGFFADPAIERRKLERVSKTLGGLDGWQKWQFFTTPKASLGGVTPLEALKRGRYEKVVTAATGFAER